MKRAAWWKGLVKYAIGLGVLAYVVAANWNDKVAPNGAVTPGLRNLLQREPNWLPLLAVAVTLVAATCVTFVRWYLLVRALDLPFKLRDAFRLGMVGVFFNTCLPGSVGGDVLKAYYIVREQPSRRAAAGATVLIDRIIGLFGMFLYAAVVGGVCWAAGDPKVAGNANLREIVTVCLIGVGVLAVGWVVLGVLPDRRAERFTERLRGIPKAGGLLAEVWDAVRMYRRRPGAVYLAILLSAVYHTGLMVIFHCGVQVFPGLEIASLTEHLVIAPIGFIMQAFFPAPGGVGGGEAIFGWLYTLLGRADTPGVVGRLTMRAAEIAFSLIGAVVFVRMRSEIRTPAEPADARATLTPSAPAPSGPAGVS